MKDWVLNYIAQAMSDPMKVYIGGLKFLLQQMDVRIEDNETKVEILLEAHDLIRDRLDVLEPGWDDDNVIEVTAEVIDP
jgi:hypothetical protein